MDILPWILLTVIAILLLVLFYGRKGFRAIAEEVKLLRQHVTTLKAPPPRTPVPMPVLPKAVVTPPVEIKPIPVPPPFNPPGITSLIETSPSSCIVEEVVETLPEKPHRTVLGNTIDTIVPEPEFDWTKNFATLFVVENPKKKPVRKRGSRAKKPVKKKSKKK